MKRKRLRTIGSKMTVLFLICALLISAALSVFSYYSSWEEYTGFFSRKAQEMVAIIADNADGDKIAAYLATGQKDEYYETLERVLASIKREENINYLYLFYPEDDHFTYILEAALDTDDLNYINEMGDIYEYTELEYTYLVPDVAAKRASTAKVISESFSYGPSVSAWAPILTSSGELAAMVEADYSITTVTSLLRANVLNSILMSLGLITVMMVVLYVFTRRMVSRPLQLLTKHALSFVNANTLAFPEDIHTGDEMQTLSEAFGQMARDIAQYTKHVEAVAADKERIAAELNLATSIQISLLPQAYPAFPERDEFDVYARLVPAKIAGGDFYDYFLIDPQRLCFVVGSVEGKGIPAALFMVVAKTIIKNQMMAGQPAGEAMGLINARLFGSGAASMAVSAFVGVLEISAGRLLYVNAGGPAPMLMREGSYETLPGQEMPKLAEIESVSYRAMELQLRQGDRLLLLSGGAVEARNAQGQPFGRERLRALLEGGRGKDVDLPAVLQRACDGIAVFEEGQERETDVTLLLLEYCKGDRALAELAVRAREDAAASVQKFLKRQLAENGIAGPAYAVLGMAAEEAFVLAARRVPGRGEITARCAVQETPGSKTATISLLYAGAQEDPLEAASGMEREAADFIRRSMDEVRYAYADGKNILAMIKHFPQK